jgi:hypothetical protein
MKDSGRKWLAPVAVAMLAAYPVLYLAAQNPGQFQLGTVGLVALASVVSFALAWLVLSLLGATRESAMLGTAVLIAMFYSYGSVAGWIDGYVLRLGLGDFATPNALDMNPHARHRFAAGWGLIAVLLAVLVARAGAGRGERLVQTVAVAALGLCAYSLVQIAIGMVSSGSGAVGRGVAGDPHAGKQGTVRPDVFFMVFDGYARQDVLARYYDFDNGPFLDALRARGLQVPTGTSSNYNWTFLSLASTLNLDYLQVLVPGIQPRDGKDRSVLYELIRDNAVARFLRLQGYEIVHVRSTWGATSVNPYADVEIRCETSTYANEFVRAVAESSWLGAFNSKGTIGLAQCHLANFDSLGNLKPRGRPRFVFAHFVLPHHPYLFDRQGRILRDAVVSNQFEFQKQLWEDRAAYRGQLEYVNSKILSLVDELLDGRESNPPIIVIESDHGPGLARGISGPEHYAIRFANLGAYYLPGAPADLIPSNGTAVNQFRRILSYYFGAELAPLPDRHFASPYSAPYEFGEIPHEVLRQWWNSIDTPIPSAETAGSKVLDIGDAIEE